jgi:hypothetical protein
MYKYLISHTSGSAKRIGNLISAIEKANSPPPPPERELTRKKLVYLPPILGMVFMNKVKKSRLIELTLSRISLF